MVPQSTVFSPLISLCWEMWRHGERRPANSPVNRWYTFIINYYNWKGHGIYTRIIQKTIPITWMHLLLFCSLTLTIQFIRSNVCMCFSTGHMFVYFILFMTCILFKKLMLVIAPQQQHKLSGVSFCRLLSFHQWFIHIHIYRLCRSAHCLQMHNYQ